MSDEAPCRYCGHWDVPNDEKMYCLKHYRRTFHDKGCDICELEAENKALREAIKTHKDSFIGKESDIVPEDDVLWAALDKLKAGEL